MDNEMNLVATVLSLSTGEELCVFVSEEKLPLLAEAKSEDIVGYRKMAWAVPDGLPEVEISFLNGTSMLCCMDAEHIAAASELCAVRKIEVSRFSEYISILGQEQELDRRFTQVTLFINNHPNKAKRVELHRRYIKCRAAYVAALEALAEQAS